MCTYSGHYTGLPLRFTQRSHYWVKIMQNLQFESSCRWSWFTNGHRWNKNRKLMSATWWKEWITLSIFWLAHASPQEDSNTQQQTMPPEKQWCQPWNQMRSTQKSHKLRHLQLFQDTDRPACVLSRTALQSKYKKRRVWIHFKALSQHWNSP